MSAQPPTEEKSPERISREELYEDIKDAAHCSRVYLAMVLSAIIGVLMNVDPTLPELALRTQVRVGDVMLALASGCAGALAFTSGVSATLIGVMVAVALMPPLVTFGLLVGGGYPILAMGALLLFLVNLICINLAGVITFQIQGIHPATWWETDRATKVTRIALGLRSLSS
jgi:uncharacterized membrane protein